MEAPRLLPAWTEDVVAPAMLFVVIAGVGLCMPPHNDTWWHLRAGREMVRTGGILATESFSHTAYGTPLYHNHEWLTQLVLFGLNQIGGPLLLALVGTACALAAVAGSWGMVKSSADARVGWLMVLFIGTVTEWAIRPQVISLALFVLALKLATSDRGHDKWLPVLCLVWANLHAVAITGVMIAMCAAAESVLWSRANVRRSLLIAAGCVVAPFFTPLGWHYWPRVFEVVRLARAFEIQEYRSALELAQLPFWVFVAVFAGVVLRSRGRGLGLATSDRRTRILVLVAALFAVAGMMSVRNIPMFVLAAVPAVSRLLPESTIRRRVKPAPMSAAVFMGGVVVVAVTLVVYAWREGGAHLGWTPISDTAIASVRQCDGRLFNGFADGGALTWFVPERRVFVDSRGVEAYPVTVLQRSRDADLFGEYERLFKDFDIGCAAVAADSIMAQRLSTDPSMKQQYADHQWVVFERNEDRH